MAAAKSRPLPGHIAWRSGRLPELLRALKKALDHATADPRTEALRGILDAHARAQGCVRGGEPRRWMTAKEYTAWRAEHPGYRQDAERHRAAAMSLPAKFRRERAQKARASWGVE